MGDKGVESGPGNAGFVEAVEDSDSVQSSRLTEVEKQNRLLERKLARLESNVRQMEQMQDGTSRLLSSLTEELAEERAKSQRLLLNILPQAIIDRLEAGEPVIADRFPEVTVLFSDFMGFTEIRSTRLASPPDANRGHQVARLGIPSFTSSAPPVHRTRSRQPCRSSPLLPRFALA
jgi:hypothetical protein